MTCIQKWTSSLKLVAILAQCRYTEIAQRIFKYNDIRYTGLTLDRKTEHFDIYNPILYQHIWQLQTFKNNQDFWPTLYTES